MSTQNSADSGKESMSSGGNKSNLSYCAFDYGLVVVQRLLICFSAIIGYDLVSAPVDFPQMFLVGSVMRIIRNFFMITKSVRKWLAINYNDGIIPEPPVRCVRPLRLTRRSTPMDSHLESHMSGGLTHSPIGHRYLSVKNYDLATALKEHHNRSGDAEHRYYADSHSSDFLGHSSSLSLRLLLNGFARSFTGCLDDPDEELNTQNDASHGKTAERNGADNEFQTSENRRRNDMVVESVLENDAMQKLNANSSVEKVPLPVPIFDDTSTAIFHS